MRDNMKSKRASRAEGDEEEEEEEEEGKGPAIATTAADSSALAMVSCRMTSLRQGGEGGRGVESLVLWRGLGAMLIFQDLAMVNSGTSREIASPRWCKQWRVIRKSVQDGEVIDCVFTNRT